MVISKFLDPKNDVHFNRIFGTEKEEGHSDSLHSVAISDYTPLSVPRE